MTDCPEQAMKDGGHIDVFFGSTNMSNCMNAAMDAALGKKVLLVDQNAFFGGGVDSALTLQNIHSSNHCGSSIQIERSWCTPQVEDILIDFGACPLGTSHPVIKSCVELKFSSDHLLMMEIKPLYYFFEGRYYKVCNYESNFSFRSPKRIFF